MSNFHQKVVDVLTAADESLYEDRKQADKLADGVVDLCKEEFKVTENTSDGYHTFKELYDHRIALFIALAMSYTQYAWRSKKHADGSEIEGWFIAGMHLPTGDITYHLPLSMWDSLANNRRAVETLKKAPEWDGHTAEDVVSRIQAWVETL